MAYRNNNSGCGCLIAIIFVTAILSGIKDCSKKMINGEDILPNFGSPHVSGGSGGIGTSNGYNIQYNHTTSPNYNSSSQDYTHTNNHPTEYSEGSNVKKTNTNDIGSTSSYPSCVNSASHISNSESSSSNTTISPKSNIQEPTIYYEKCPICHGSGKIHTIDYYNEYLSISLNSKCLECGRTDKHSHERIESCSYCMGKGRLIVEKTYGPLGEIESRRIDW